MIEYGLLPVRLMVLAAARFVLAEAMSAIGAAGLAALKTVRQSRFSKASTYRGRLILPSCRRLDVSGIVPDPESQFVEPHASPPGAVNVQGSIGSPASPGDSLFHATSARRPVEENS